ncbi:MAG: pilus assembly protein PilM [Planctomycetota bacterium]
MARTATGVDVGLRTIKVLRGQYKGNTFHVSDFALSQNDASVGDADWVTRGWNSLALDFKPTAARVGLTGHDVNIRYTRVPRVPDWQLRNLMRFEVSEIGDQSGSEVASDFNLLPELPEIEGEDVVLLALAREALLASHTQGLKSVGGTLDSFSPSAVALYNAFLRYGVVQDETVLLANIGHDNIDAVITRGPDLLFARNLSGGSRLFDDAIAQRFQVKAAQAEKIKCEMASLAPGASHPTPNHERASRAILGAAGQLLSLLQSTVLFCKSQVKISGLKVDRVLLCGGGAALEGLPQYLAAGMNVPVELFDPFRVVEVGGLDPASADLLEEYKLEAVVALGLATMGSDPEAYGIEILPSAVARARAFFGGTLWLIAAAVLAVAFLGFKAWSYSGQLSDVVQENRGLASKVDRANRTHNEAVRLVEENEQLRSLVLELQAVGGTGEQAARVVEFLDGALPGTFWVSQLSSDWSFDPELGVPRTEPRPILSLRGRIHEGTASPTELFTRMMLELDKHLPGVRYNEGIDQDLFTIDLSLFAPSVEDGPTRTGGQ